MTPTPGPSARRRLLGGLIGLALASSLVPPATAQVLAPGEVTNPIGTMRWLPDDANEQRSIFPWMSRLVVVYDHSLDAQGDPVPLLADGAFTFSIWTPTGGPVDTVQGPHPALLQVWGWSPSIVEAVDVPEMELLSGDVRDGDCSKLETGGFSEAYSRTRTFVHDGPTPYQPVRSPGHCEVVDSSREIRDDGGAVAGFETTVTDHVPGFWIKTRWPSQGIPDEDGRDGRIAATAWYSAMYGDDMGDSETLGAPGDYDEMLTFEAEQGQCQSRSVVVEAGSKRTDFSIYPTGDWDLTVTGPDGVTRTASAPRGFEERITTPGYTGVDLPAFTPGEHTMRACNVDGEEHVLGTVITEDGTELRDTPCRGNWPTTVLELRHLPANPYVYLKLRVPAQVNKEQAVLYMDGRAASSEDTRLDLFRIGDSEEWTFRGWGSMSTTEPPNPFVRGTTVDRTVEVSPEYALGGGVGIGLPPIKEEAQNVRWFTSMWQRYAAGHGRLILCGPPGTEMQSWRVGRLTTATASDMEGTSAGWEGAALLPDTVVSPDGLSFSVDIERGMTSFAFAPNREEGDPDFSYTAPDGTTRAIPDLDILVNAPSGRHRWRVGDRVGGSAKLMIADVLLD